VKNTSHIVARAFALGVAAELLAGCSGTQQSPLLPPAPASGPTQSTGEPNRLGLGRGFVYVANRTNKGDSQLIVYPAGTPDATPMKTIRHGLVDAAGVAVDPSGNVYVANGSGGNVLEFSPGGSSLVQMYSQGLADPVAVAVANGTLYVSDRGNAANGYSQQVLEYRVGQTRLLMRISGVGTPSQRNAGIAVDSLGTKNTFYLAASSTASIPPPGGCPKNSNFIFAENLLQSLWRIVSLGHNRQALGVAFDADGKLYVADVCDDDIAIYTDTDEVWTYSGTVAGTFDAPAYLTVENETLAVPSSATDSSAGYVSLIDLTGRASALTIAKGLTHPMGAAVAPDSWIRPPIKR
jgi:hypothetical protein